MKQNSNVEEFLKQMDSDEKLRKLFDNIIDETIWTVAVSVGEERGLNFTKLELEQAISQKLNLGEYKLSNDGGPGHCKSDSGCRSPCVYCKSNMVPSFSEIGQKFGRKQDH